MNVMNDPIDINHRENNKNCAKFIFILVAISDTFANFREFVFNKDFTILKD